jgi:hypothetical protein
VLIDVGLAAELVDVTKATDVFLLFHLDSPDHQHFLVIACVTKGIAAAMVLSVFDSFKMVQ